MTAVRAAVARLAASDGDRIAVRSAIGNLTYRDLDERAARVTGYLRSRGVGDGDRVVVRMARGIDLFPVLLGVVAAGAAFVPIESSSTVDRASRIVRSSAPAFVVTEETLRGDELPSGTDAVTLVDMLGHDPAPAVPDSDRPAYVIFTSGTTGEPKGVVVGTAALDRYLRWARSEYRMDEGNGAPLFTSIAFDATLTTLFGPLLAGTTITIIGDDPVVGLANSLRRDPDFSFVKATPHHVRLLAELLDGETLRAAMRFLVVGGDELDTVTVARWTAICPVPVVNEYGPTETVVGCSAFTVLPEEVSGLGVTVPIGRGIAGARLHVLDASGELTAAGEVGELYIAGPSANSAYFARPAATAARFVPDPFGEAGARMYRTGDLASLRADGVLEYHGRGDRQIKVRGYRVELGEIEAAVRMASGVVDAAAFAERENGEVTTTVVYTGDADSGAVRAELTARIPAWIVPHRLVQAAVLPTTANAKANVAALLAVADAASEDTEEVDAVTADVFAGFAAVLPAGALTAESDFYALGGDSMKSIRLVARLRRHGYDVSPADIPANPTPLALAALVAGRSAAPASARATTVGHEVAPTPAQRDFFDLDLPDPGHWNQVTVLAAPAGIDSARLFRAFGAIAARYDTFHYRFVAGRQTFADGVPAIDLHEVAVANRAVLEQTIRDANAGLRLEHGPLVRLVVARLPEGPAHLILVAHHLVIDEVSWHVLLDDLIAAYRDSVDSKAVASPGFAQWRADLATFATGSDVQARRAYWDQVLDTPVGRLPAERDPDDYADEHYHRDGLDAEATAALREAAASARTAIHEVLLGTLVDAIGSTFDIDPPRVDVETHGRVDIAGGVDASRVIGWCTAIFPVALTGGSVVELVGSARSVLGAQPWGGAEFGLLRVGETAPSRSAGVLFNFLGERESLLDEGLGWTLVDAPAGAQSPPSGRRPYALEFQSRLIDGELRWELRAGSRHSTEVVRHLSNRLREGLATATSGLADDPNLRFADSGLNASELSAVLAQLSGSDGGAR